MVCGEESIGEELTEDFICPVCQHPASDLKKRLYDDSGMNKPYDY